jgi:hypothetical protein
MLRFTPFSERLDVELSSGDRGVYGFCGINRVLLISAFHRGALPLWRMSTVLQQVSRN